MNKYYLVGIKGTGMSSLAILLKDLGYFVIGSDDDIEYFTVDNLLNNDITILPFSEKNIKEDYIYIASSSYDSENIEIAKIIEKEYKLYYYHDFIASFFKEKKIAVSGTHGKTTTTSLLAGLCSIEKISYLIGDGEGKGMKNSSYFIYEACEYKNHFLKYKNDYLIINNIDYDHPDFFKDIEEVISSFQKASNNSKVVIINGDDENCGLIVHDNKITFGLNMNNDIKGIIKNKTKEGFDLNVIIKNKEYSFKLPFCGEHMIYNFLAALTVYNLIGLDMSKVQSLINNYAMPFKRMKEYYYKDNIIIDDYAHHPKEITSLINAIRQKYPNKKIEVVFQPHTYSRTIELKDDFIKVFKDIDKLYIEETFTSKREEVNENMQKLVNSIFSYANIFTQDSIENFKKVNNTVIVFLGAGVVSKYIKKIYENEFQKKL